MAYGTWLSELDALAMSMIGREDVDRLFQSLPAARFLARDLSQYLGDARAERALRKAAHKILEDRLRVLALRADPPQEYGFGSDLRVPDGDHPLDGYAKNLLADHTDRARRVPTPKLFLAPAMSLSAVLIRVALFLAEAGFLFARHGRTQLERTAYAVGAPESVVGARWEPLRQAASEEGFCPDDAPFVLIEDTSRGTTVSDNIPKAAVSTLPIEREKWAREVLGPGMRLATGVIGKAIAGWRNPWILQLCMETIAIARESLAIHRIAHNFRFRWYLDIEEYAQRHIVKSIVLGRVGTKLVRWPHAVMDTPGATLTYLDYAVFLAGGTYEAETFGETWSPHCRPVAVGMVRNDRRVATPDQVKDEYRAAVETLRNYGGKLIVYFLPSIMPGRGKLIRATAEAVIRQVAARPDWLLIIKPKGRRNQMVEAIVADYGHLRFGDGSARIILVHYDRPNTEICSTGWLIEQMDVGIGIGSVLFESLTHFKPVLAYYPVNQVTPCTDQLVAAGLLHNTPKQFETALGRWMDDPRHCDVPYQWFRDAFDPYADDEALSRIANILWGGEAETDHAATRAREAVEEL